MAPHTILSPSPLLLPRQNSGILDDQNQCQSVFFWCGTGSGARYGATAGIIIGIILLIFLARLHARRRQAKGLQPLLYHRWTVRTDPPDQHNMTSTQYGHGPGRMVVDEHGRVRVRGHGVARPAEGTHETDYEIPGWQYPPPPPAYVPEANPPGYYAPPPGYEAKKGEGGAAVREVGEERVGESSRVSQQGEERAVGAQETGQSVMPVYR